MTADPNGPTDLNGGDFDRGAHRIDLRSPTRAGRYPTTDMPPRAKRWVPLSLRIYLATMALLGVASVLFVGMPIYEQLIAIREIKRLGGGVSAQQGGPDWLRDWLGDERMQGFDAVNSVNFYKSEIDDQRLWCCRKLADLKLLFLHKTKVTDDGIARLSGITSLTQITLGETSVSDAGLAHLKQLTKLKGLTLDHTRITDIGLQYLKGLPELELLSLEHTAVTDEGIRTCAAFKNLQSLQLSSTHVTDAGLVHLIGLANLERVDLLNTSVTDAGIADLQRAMPQLWIAR